MKESLRTSFAKAYLNLEAYDDMDAHVYADIKSYLDSLAPVDDYSDATDFTDSDYEPDPLEEDEEDEECRSLSQKDTRILHHRWQESHKHSPSHRLRQIPVSVQDEHYSATSLADLPQAHERPNRSSRPSHRLQRLTRQS